jgi:hypothetical protein
LLPNGKIRGGDLEVCERIIALNVESIESGSNHEVQLLQEHITDGTQFAPKIILFPQEPCVGVRSAVAKSREF